MEERKQAQSEVPEMAIRPFRGPEDHPILHAIYQASNEADQIADACSVDEIARRCTASERLDPAKDILIATVQSEDQDEVPVDVGFAFTAWYTGPEDVRHYYQESYLLPEWRSRGIWHPMVRHCESRLRQKALDDQIAPSRGKLFAFARDTQDELIVVLEHEHYEAVRQFHNMIHDLQNIPVHPLPPGFEVRTVVDSQLRPIWQAQHEVNQELFEYNADRWTEERFQKWRESSAQHHALWQIAWEGDQVAGLVLGKIDEEENRQQDRLRGYTHSILIREPWRRRGLGRALISQCLQALKDRGINEAELGVDAINESGAFKLYTSLGYRTETIDTWYCKALSG